MPRYRTPTTTPSQPSQPGRPAARRTQRRRSLGDCGAGMVEYALLVSLIALVCLSALQVFGVTNGGSIGRSSSSVSESLDP